MLVVVNVSRTIQVKAVEVAQFSRLYRLVFSLPMSDSHNCSEVRGFKVNQYPWDVCM